MFWILNDSFLLLIVISLLISNYVYSTLIFFPGQKNFSATKLINMLIGIIILKD